MILIALGANLPSRFGTPEETLHAAYRALTAKGIAVAKASRIWITAPVPASDQPDYRNAVAAVETDRDALALVRALKAIEREFGRIEAVQNAPRVIDLDLLAFHDEIHNTDELTVPHPRLHERAFVVLPLSDIAPGWRHPLLEKTTNELLKLLPQGQDARPMEAKVA
jgi:2-amino-4-hydroxy-6-hydroxymethyldihydropteridine diphosphokinase